MAKTSSPPLAAQTAPQPKVHRYINAQFGDDFGRLSNLTINSANSFARKKLDAASQSLQLRAEIQDKKARRIEIREWRAAERSVAAELQDGDRRIRLLWRSLKTKVRPEKKVAHTPPKGRTRLWPYAAVALTKYDGPVIDRRGQRGVFMRVRYYSRRTAEAGVSQRVVKYCFNGAELDLDGNPYIATNIGATIDEALCGFDHLEQINWSAAKNAKLMLHGILAMDHRQTADEMMSVGMRWAEEAIGRFDLPYLVTLHAPPPDGDQRNWHCHVLWSYRPMKRIGDHEWAVGEMLRTDLDNPRAMKLMRQMFAEVMTHSSFEAGQNQVWTAKSNADRGLPHERQQHLGGAKTNRARSGEYVADNEENHERVLRSKAAVIDDRLRHIDEALAHEQEAQRAIVRHWARLPTVPMRLPQPIIAAAMTAALPRPPRGVPFAPSNAIMSPLPTRLATPEVLSKTMLPPASRALPLVDIGQRVVNLERHVPPMPSIVARVDFANLRKPVATVDLPARPGPAPYPSARSGHVAPLQSAPAVSRMVELATMPSRTMLRLPISVRAYPIAKLATPLRNMPQANVPETPTALPRRPAIPARLPSFLPLAAAAPVVRLEPMYTVRDNIVGKLRVAEERRRREEAQAAAMAVATAETDAAAASRRRQVAEACRILSQSPRRPYRVVGERAFLDLNVMGRRERNAVVSAGLSEREVTDALVARVRGDRAEDNRLQASGKPPAMQLDRLTILGRVADQQQTATSEWVSTGSLVAWWPGRQSRSPKLIPSVGTVPPLPRLQRNSPLVSVTIEPPPSHRRA